jgi:hypothetical protein
MKTAAENLKNQLSAKLKEGERDLHKILDEEVEEDEEEDDEEEGEIRERRDRRGREEDEEEDNDI